MVCMMSYGIRIQKALIGVSAFLLGVKNENGKKSPYTFNGIGNYEF